MMLKERALTVIVGLAALFVAIGLLVPPTRAVPPVSAPLLVA